MESDPRVAPVQLTITGTSALLLARLAVELGTDDPGAVMMRALGLLEMALGARRSGRKLAFYDPDRDEIAEVAF